MASAELCLACLQGHDAAQDFEDARRCDQALEVQQRSREGSSQPAHQQCQAQEHCCRVQWPEEAIQEVMQSVCDCDRGTVHVTGMRACVLVYMYMYLSLHECLEANISF